MARWKHLHRSWNVVLAIVLLSPSVCSRPSSEITVDTISSSIISTTALPNTEKATENSSRYSNVHVNNYLRFNRSDFVLNIRPVLNKYNFGNKSIYAYNHKTSHDNSHFYFNDENNAPHNDSQRKSRLIRNNKTEAKVNLNKFTKNGMSPNTKNNFELPDNNINSRESEEKSSKKPVIRKIITTWTDKVKFEDTNYPYDSLEQNVKEPLSFEDASDGVLNTESNLIDYSSTELSMSTKLSSKLYNKLTNKIYRPNRPLTEETQVYSQNIHVTDDESVYYKPHLTTPTPAPLVTNVGHPNLWTHSQHNQQYKPTYTAHAQSNQNYKPSPYKPTKATNNNQYNYHNTISNYQKPNHNTYEVSTFQPATAYTERIVIRPEEYNGEPNDCPTIYLTLNNTFQGQAKEVCPDLNIAVNTNVINKNVVIESDEEDSDDSFLPGSFGLPSDDDSSSDNGPLNDYFESEENQNQGESASVENIENGEIVNYNSPNSADAGTTSSGSSHVMQGSPSSALSSYNRPNAPLKDDYDDDFGFSSLAGLFRPALKFFSWFATISPISFGLFSFFVAPLTIFLAGTSGLAAIFAPWALPYARQHTGAIHHYGPHLPWDNDMKTWYLNSFLNNRRWRPNELRGSKEVLKTNNNKSYKQTIFKNIRDSLGNITSYLRNIPKSLFLGQDRRKNKRKKRQIWTFRIK